MANNKLWAVCKDDNKATCLAKYYPGPPGWGGGFNSDDEFFNDHDDCPSNQGCGENIVFVTESDDRVKLIDFSNKYKGDGHIRIYLKNDKQESF